MDRAILYDVPVKGKKSEATKDDDDDLLCVCALYRKAAKRTEASDAYDAPTGHLRRLLK
jgi:hypothetical protein